MSAARGRRTIRVAKLARIAGEGGLHVRVRGGAVTEVELRIFEPPRFIETLLRGRPATEAPDCSSRICGLCPAAYQMSAARAVERAFGIHVDGPLRTLRRLMHCGEWIQSHALHVFLLHAPDFLGYESAIHMAKDHPAAIERGLRIKQVGNDLVALLGGREIHPINVRVGGFYRLPADAELRQIAERLKRARDAALETVSWVAGFPVPDFEREYDFLALRHPSEYPLDEGRLASNRGLDIDLSEFETHVLAEHVPHSGAPHWVLKERGGYAVGPLARYNLNFDRLSPLAQQAAREGGLGQTCTNPFRSIVVRAVEMTWACDEALHLIASYCPPEQASLPFAPRAGVGHACVEAPRGVLYQRYRLDPDGTIGEARIVPPTAQNQKTIESDLRHFVDQHLHLPDDKLAWRCEQVVRNYDPCVSCATHVL